MKRPLGSRVPRRKQRYLRHFKHYVDRRPHLRRLANRRDRMRAKRDLRGAR